MNRQNDGAEQDRVEVSTPSEELSCQQQLHTCQEALRTAEERYIYLAADFKNYQRRMEQERIRLINGARKDSMLKVLKLVDNFERAEATLGGIDTITADALDRVRSGIELMHKEAVKILEEHRVRPLEQMTQFDPALHEAILSVAPDQLAEPLPAGTIVTVLEKGYTLDGELIRPARVAIVADA